MSIRDWFGKKEPPPSETSLSVQVSKEAAPAELRLIDVVRRNRTASGGFMNLYNDLAPVWKPDLHALIQMAYAYARRDATYGLFFQGVAKRADVEKSEQIFRSLQASTGQTIAFQEAASSQASELIKEYLPQFSFSHLLVVATYARQGMDAQDVALLPTVDMEIDEDGCPYGVDTCFAVADVLVKLGMRAKQGELPDRPMRLIDVVEKTANSRFGPFANMFEDLKASKEKLVNDPLLSTATGYGMWLAGAGAFVAGGMKTDIVLDAQKLLTVFLRDARDNRLMLDDGKAQALALARTYVRELDEESAEEIMSSAHEFVNFYVDEERRLTAVEVVERAKERATVRTSGHVGWNSAL